jgi:hypothetical protein
MIFIQLNIQRGLSYFHQLTKFIQNMPIIMNNLFIFLTLENKMIQKFKTFLKNIYIFFIYLFSFLFLYKINICL